MVNGTAGVIQDETGTLVCLPTVEKTYRALPMTEIIAYAPVADCRPF